MVALAFCLFASPWAAGYHDDTAARWNAWLVAFFLAYTAFAELFEMLVWEEWATVALGLWLAVAPWVLGFTTDLAATLTQVTVAVVVLLLSGIELWRAQHPPHNPAS